ncbi:MAG: Flp family type IVb pilin [Geminicoccaceae bacterium]
MFALRRFLKDRSGATAIEYALIAALMATVIIAGIKIVGGDLKTSFTNIGNCLTAPDKCS